VTNAAVEEALRLRIHPGSSGPALVYLPGLHGDWTLIGGFRRALRQRIQFVEMTYPRTLNWSLDQYAESIENALSAAGIHGGVLLGESFGSQITWAIAARNRFSCRALIFAGGFVRHPFPPMVRVARWMLGATPASLTKCITVAYAKMLRFRFRHSPEVLETLAEFFQRRTKLDGQAAQHRLALIIQNDFCSVARSTQIPTFVLTGLLDPIVPWMFVRRWMRCNCPALREHRIIWQADHNVLGTAPQQAAELIIEWAQQTPN
jgi:pimeloyl-ACP methyl ester carboxylesterase